MHALVVCTAKKTTKLKGHFCYLFFFSLENVQTFYLHPTNVKLQPICAELFFETYKTFIYQLLYTLVCCLAKRTMTQHIFRISLPQQEPTSLIRGCQNGIIFMPQFWPDNVKNAPGETRKSWKLRSPDPGLFTGMP